MHPNGHNRRQYSEAEAYQRLSALCATAEYCKTDILKKMAAWDIDPAGKAQERIISRLEREHFIDEGRYAHAFVRDKFRYNRWGRMRIDRELRLRGISPDIIDDALGEISDDDTLETLRRLLTQKRPSVRGKTDYEVKMKLIRFALSRGFEMETIRKAVDNIPDDITE